MGPKGIPRALETILALLGLVMAAPLMLVAALAVKVSSSGPVFYRQQRVGLGGKTFVLVKFRTMREEAVGPLITAKGDERITHVGRLLRVSKLDELPELWNVAKGEMSLVGPRPEVPEYVDQGDPLWQEVLRVRPGITDPVSLRLRDEEGILRMAGDDLEHFYRKVLQPLKLNGYAQYMANRSPWSDLRVIVQTVWAVFVPSAIRSARVREALGIWDQRLSCDARQRRWK